MSHDDNWSVDKHREEHESDEQWALRRAFLERWKSIFPEERLLCLARVFVNIEFLGCRYPPEVMKEIATLSVEIAKSHREQKKGKLQRTFVSASNAAEDRAKGVKRKGGIIENSDQKPSKISFVPQGHTLNNTIIEATGGSDSDSEETEKINEKKSIQTPTIDNQNSNQDTLKETPTHPGLSNLEMYLTELKQLSCVDVRRFQEDMFNTCFGRLVLLVRPWTNKTGNIQASCQACRLSNVGTFNDSLFEWKINNVLVAKAKGAVRADTKNIVESMVWNRLQQECISVLVKEQWIAQGDARITTDDVTGKRHLDAQFGTPIESNVATKMMKMMGWSGGGLGADAQGISEPIKPHMQMVNRAGLGSNGSDIQQLKRAATTLMHRYCASDWLDLDLVFSSDFSKEERALLHTIAKRNGLASTSYGKNADRFLVVKKKLDPFSLVRAIIDKGGNTPKYQVFIPSSLANRRY